eukprot:TRINITY_DN41483_c0_g1_i1.p1 TRINITY_DN41483_c0_g1~~TRINITY_DN41483_c0_g1_i1.p1  ORF type:complete len:235 (-),score=34.17 TRINITY_DN41483_c0_g1_i1:153-824(-)
MDIFTFTLRRAPGVGLGLDFLPDEAGSKGLLVRSVLKDEAVDAWNSVHGGQGLRIIRPADEIIAVNGLHHDTALMKEECQTKELLKLTVVRKGSLHSQCELRGTPTATKIATPVFKKLPATLPFAFDPSPRREADLEHTNVPLICPPPPPPKASHPEAAKHTTGSFTQLSNDTERPVAIKRPPSLKQPPHFKASPHFKAPPPFKASPPFKMPPVASSDALSHE